MFEHASMQVLRKKNLQALLISLAVSALFNVSIQLDSILTCFPNINTSYLLMEELAECGEAENEKGPESSFGFEFTLAKQAHSFQTQFFTRSVDVCIHSCQIPPHPHFEKDTPPPKG